MIYLITGATGLVGNVIKQRCFDSDIKVHYLTTSKHKIIVSNKEHGFYWNPRQGEIDLDAFKGVSKIIHLAGATVAKKWTDSYKKVILDSRINTTQLLFNSLKKIEHQVDQIISASAIGIYPDSLTNYYMESHEEKSNDFLGMVVKQWEAEVDKLSKLGISVAKVRIGLVLSEKGGALPQMAKPVRFGVGSAFGSGKQWQSWIHIEDLAGIFLFLAKHNLIGIFNGVSPNAISQNKLIKHIGKVLDRPVFLPNIPPFIAKMLLGEMSQLLLSSQRVCSGKIGQHNYKFKFATIESALNNLLANKNN